MVKIKKKKKESSGELKKCIDVQVPDRECLNQLGWGVASRYFLKALISSQGIRITGLSYQLVSFISNIPCQ